MRLTTVATPEAAAVKCAEALALLLRNALGERGEAHLALNGGSTPRPVYEQLPAMLDDWSGVHVWFGDERCVPPDDAESNFRMARESLLDRVAPLSVHRMPGELGAGADQDRFGAAPDFDRVVGDQPVAADDQVERALALADAALADQQHAEPEHVEQHAVHDRPLGERVLENRRELGDGSRRDRERGRWLRRPSERDHAGRTEIASGQS